MFTPMLSVNDINKVLQMLLAHESDPTLLTCNKLRPSRSARKMGNIRAAVVLERGEANWIARGKTRRRRSFMKQCFCSYCSVLQKKGPDGTVKGVDFQRGAFQPDSFSRPSVQLPN